MLGLGLKELTETKTEVSESAQKLLEERVKAKADKNFQRADEIRDELKALGFKVIDSKDGALLEKI